MSRKRPDLNTHARSTAYHYDGGLMGEDCGEAGHVVTGTLVVMIHNSYSIFLGEVMCTRGTLGCSDIRFVWIE
jgi:hypothetical protein